MPMTEARVAIMEFVSDFPGTLIIVAQWVTSVPVGNAQTTSASERSVAEVKSSTSLHDSAIKDEVCVDSGSNRSVIDGDSDVKR